MYPPLFKIRTERDWRKTAVIVHTVAVAAMALWISYLGGDPAILWCVFLVIDLPLGWVTAFIVNIMDEPGISIGSYFDYVVLPAICFAVLGGLQWYWIVGWITGRHAPEPLKCIDCGYDLRGSLESGRCPECGSAFEVDGLRK